MTSRKGEEDNKAVKHHWNREDNTSKARNARLTQALLHHLQNNPVWLGKGPQVQFKEVNAEAFNVDELR